VVTRHAQHGGGHAHTNAGLVHHVEHAVQALAWFAHQIADGTGALPVQACTAIGALAGQHLELAFAKVQQCVGGTAPAAFVVQPCQGHVVALAGELALGVDQLFGHDEQRNALYARRQLTRFVRNFGQHQVNDVFGQLVLAS
jgi:hypothetical protein